MAKVGNSKEKFIRVAFQPNMFVNTTPQCNAAEQRRLYQHIYLGHVAEKDLADTSKKTRQEVVNVRAECDKGQGERSTLQSTAVKQGGTWKFAAVEKAFEVRKQLGADVNALLNKHVAYDNASQKGIAREIDEDINGVDDAGISSDQKARVKRWNDEREARKKPARKQDLTHNAIVGTKVVSTLPAGITDCNSVRAALTNTIEHFKQVGLVGCQTIKNVNSYAANLRSFTTLDRRPGMPSDAIAGLLRPRRETQEEEAAVPAIQMTQLSGVHGTSARDRIHAKEIARLSGGAIGKMFDQGVGNGAHMAPGKANFANEMTNTQRVAGVRQTHGIPIRRAYESSGLHDMSLSDNVTTSSTSPWQEMGPGSRRWLECEVQRRLLADVRKAGPQVSDARRAEAKNRAAMAKHQLGWSTLHELSQQSRRGITPILPEVNPSRMA